jgi:hypothetical protein
MTFIFDNKLDQQFLQSLYEDDLSYAQEVFEEFLTGTKSEFEAIKNDYRDNVLKAMRQKLHKIKPTFSFVGLPTLTEKTETIIATCDASSNISEIEPGCGVLFKEIEDSLLLIEKELFRMKSFAA